MKVQEVKIIARSRGRIISGSMKKEEIIRAIQKSEGNFDCFKATASEWCDQSGCFWRKDCLTPQKR